jgi:hypothetical protein
VITVILIAAAFRDGLGPFYPAASDIQGGETMKLTWFGHSAFCIEAAGAKILIDPFLTGNPSWNGGWEEAAEGVTHLLLTHGHNDHVGDSAAILKKTGAMLVSNFEVCMYLVGQGVDQDKINPGNIGGTVDCGGFTTTFVQAPHSSSFGGDGGKNTYLGNPSGLVLHFPNDQTALPHGRHRHLLRHGADQRAAPAGGRHGADRRPLHDGRRRGRARLPRFFKLRDGRSPATTGRFRSSTRRRRSSWLAWRTRRQGFSCRRSARRSKSSGATVSSALQAS